MAAEACRAAVEDACLSTEEIDGMHEIQSIIKERVDDIPLLLEQMQQMGLPTLLDDHFPTHGNWQGLSHTFPQQRYRLTSLA